MVPHITDESKYLTSDLAGLLFECAPDAIVLVDHQGVIVCSNRQCETAFGYTSEELHGQKLDLLIPERFRDHHSGHRESYCQDPTTRAMGAGRELLACRKNGSEFAADIMLAPIETPTGPAVMAVVRDITERKIQDQQVRQLMQQREDYVGAVTHDLKTPILAANRAIQLLIDGDFGAISEPQLEVLKTLFESNEAMYKLVRTLLDVYRYDGGMKMLMLESHDMCQLIPHLLSELKPLAQSKMITLGASLPAGPVSVVCDSEEIRRVLQNLVGNALKFTAPGGTVEVQLEQSGNRVTTSVVDTGSGISEHVKSQLFQRFWQGATGESQPACTGMGLYLCRKIVELHHGDIWCDSKVGAGSTFCFTLAAAKDETNTNTADNTAASDSSLVQGA